MNQDQIRLLSMLARVFSPSAPVNSQDLFAGRISQIQTVLNAVSQRGQHVVLFGERGVGKTSLANVLSQIVQGAGFVGVESGTVNCDVSDDFSSLWHKIFRELRFSSSRKKIGLTDEEEIERISLDSYAPEKIDPESIRYIIQKTIGSSIIVIDELDRIQDSQTKILIADTIKTLSDHSVDSTIVLVGVADSIESLIQSHASIERSLVQVAMPRMSTEELYEIINKGLESCQMTIDGDVIKQIALLSQGLPSYTHLLALHASQSAIKGEKFNVDKSHLAEAIKISVDKAQQSLKTSYHSAVFSARETLYTQVLLACAVAESDNSGYFTATEVKKKLALIMGKSYEISAFSRHLNDFSDERRGAVLEKKGTARNYRFRFTNSMMQPYIIMNGISEGLLNEKIVKKLKI